MKMKTSQTSLTMVGDGSGDNRCDGLSGPGHHSDESTNGKRAEPATTTRVQQASKPDKRSFKTNIAHQPKVWD